MPMSTKMWLRKGCEKIYTKKNAHTCRADDGHRWQFVWAENGIAVSGGGMPYGEIDTDYADGWHNLQPLDLPLPDRPLDVFHIIRDRYLEAVTTPALTTISLLDVENVAFAHHLRLNTGDLIEIAPKRLQHIIDGMAGVAYVHTPDRHIFWIVKGKRFALLGFTDV